MYLAAGAFSPSDGFPTRHRLAEGPHASSRQTVYDI